MFTFNIPHFVYLFGEKNITKDTTTTTTTYCAHYSSGTNKMISNNINLAHFPENGK